MLLLKKFVSTGAIWTGESAGLLATKSVQHTIYKLSDLYPTRPGRGIRVAVYKIGAGAYSDRSIRSSLATLVKAGLIRRVRTKQPGAAVDDVCQTSINPALISLARDWAREQLILNYPKLPTIRSVELPMKWPVRADFNCMLIGGNEAEFEEQAEAETETETEMEIEHASI